MWTALSQRRGSSPAWDSGDADYPMNASYGVDPDYESEFDFSESDSGENVTDKARNKATGLKDRLSSGMHRAGGKASGMSHDARHSAQAMGARGRRQLNRASHDAREFMEQNPLAVGAMALAAGALIGALIPVTSRERQMLGHRADGVVEKARSAAKKSMDTMAEAGKEGARAARETIESSIGEQTQSS